MSTSYFNKHLLPALRRQCHAAICCGDNVPEPLPGKLKKEDISINHELNDDLLDAGKAVIVYSEELAAPIQYEDMSEMRALLRGGEVRNANYDAQITVYHKNIGTAYELGDIIMEHFDTTARRHVDLRYCRLVDRHSAKQEETDAWAVVYKLRIQLQPQSFTE